jgi:hypothetical protein
MTKSVTSMTSAREEEEYRSRYCGARFTFAHGQMCEARRAFMSLGGQLTP